MNAQRALGCVMLCLAMSSLGSSLFVAKFFLTVIPDMLSLSLRLAFALAVMASISSAVGSPRSALDLKIMGLVVLQGLIGVVLLNLLVFQALDATSAAEVGVIWGMLPLVVAAMSWAALGERTHAFSVIAAVLAALGTILLASSAATTGSGGRWTGTVAAIGAVFCSSLFIIIGKRLSSSLSPFHIGTLVSLTGLLIVLPLAIGEARAFEFGAIRHVEWLSLIVWSLASGVAYPLFLHAGLARVESSVAGVFTPIVPVTAIILSRAFLAEATAPAHLLGVACCLLGVTLVSYGTRPCSCQSAPGSAEATSRIF